MSQAFVRSKVEVVLHMTPGEALFLKGWLQNGPTDGTDAALRAGLFDSLPSFAALQ